MVFALAGDSTITSVRESFLGGTRYSLYMQGLRRVCGSEGGLCQMPPKDPLQHNGRPAERDGRYVMT